MIVDVLAGLCQLSAGTAAGMTAGTAAGAAVMNTGSDIGVGVLSVSSLSVAFWAACYSFVTKLEGIRCSIEGIRCSIEVLVHRFVHSVTPVTRDAGHVTPRGRNACARNYCGRNEMPFFGRNLCEIFAKCLPSLRRAGVGAIFFSKLDV